MGFPGLKSTARGGKKRCYLSGMPLIKSLLEHNSLTIANLCIMEGVFTWHSPGLSVVFCCNVGRGEGSPERDQGCGNEVCWGNLYGCPEHTRVVGQLGAQRRRGLLSPTDVESRLMTSQSVRCVRLW